MYEASQFGDTGIHWLTFSPGLPRLLIAASGLNPLLSPTQRLKAWGRGCSLVVNVVIVFSSIHLSYIGVSCRGVPCTASQQVLIV